MFGEHRLHVRQNRGEYMVDAMEHNMHTHTILKIDSHKKRDTMIHCFLFSVIYVQVCESNEEAIH